MSDSKYRRMLRGFGRRPRRDAHTEIESHLQLKTDELIAAGMQPDEAAAEARRRFGNAADVAREISALQDQIRRRESLFSGLDSLWNDVRFALRGLRARPGFLLFATASLAIGIGGATAIFSVANGLFFKPLPGVRDASALVELTQGYEDFISISYPVLEALDENVNAFEAVAGFDILTVAVGDGDDAPAVTMGLQVTAGYFDILGTRPAAGRLLTREDGRLPAANVAVISHALWLRRFDGDPGVVGSDIRLNGRMIRVVGVTEPGFHGHAAALQLDVFVPVGADVPGVHGSDSSSLTNARSGQFDTLGRLAPGVTRRQASQAADAASDRFVQAIEGDDARYPLRVLAYGSVPITARVGVATFLSVLLLVVGLVLAITCVNVTNLQLSRAAQRTREIAVRVSLGAGRAQIVRQLMVESLVVFAIGAAVGTAGAAVLVAAASGVSPAIPLPGARLAFDLTVDARVLAFATLLTALFGVVAGLVPGLQAVRRDPVDALRDGGNTTTGRQRAQTALVGAQVTATVVLLIVAGLFLRSFQASRQVELGFDTSQVVTASFDMDLAGYDDAAGALFWDRLLTEVRALPGVERASLASKLPISSRSQWAITSPGVEPPAGTRGFILSNRRVSDGHFATLDYRIVRGRGFEPTDTPGAPPVMVINETMAARLWPGENPLGRTIDNGWMQYEVVGIAADAVYHDLHEPTPGFAFVPLTQNYDDRMILHARLRTGSSAEVERLREFLAGFDTRVPVMTFERLDTGLRPRFLGDIVGATLSAAFGVVGLALAVVGVYGVTSLWTSRRRGEIGIRLAMGATGPGVMRWTVRRGLTAPGVGLVIGLLVAALAARFIASLLSGVSSFDPITFVAVPVLLTATGVVATWLPARRAARVDPAETLRRS